MRFDQLVPVGVDTELVQDQTIAFPLHVQRPVERHAADGCGRELNEWCRLVTRASLVRQPESEHPPPNEADLHFAIEIPIPGTWLNLVKLLTRPLVEYQIRASQRSREEKCALNWRKLSVPPLYKPHHC